MYLETPNAPGQRAFLRCAASFFLEIRQYSCEKMSCATQKSLAAGHIMSFQIHPKLMTLPFRGSPGKLRGWQTFRRAYRLSPGHAPRGLVQTTGTAGGYDFRNNSKQGLTKASFRAAILLTSVSKMAFVVRSVSRHAKLRGGLLKFPSLMKVIRFLQERNQGGALLNVRFPDPLRFHSTVKTKGCNRICQNDRAKIMA